MVTTSPAPLVSTCGDCTTLPGVLLASDGPDGIQRCDECAHYAGDLDAAAAVAALFPGAVVRWTDDDDEDHTGTDVPADVYIAEGTSPWVEVDGTPVDWTTTPVPTPGRVSPAFLAAAATAEPAARRRPSRLCGRPGCPLFVVPNEHADAWEHLHRGDEADTATDESHAPSPSALAAPLSVWREHGPDDVRARFTT